MNREETITEIARLINGLAVPVSLGMGRDGLLGTAYEPWEKLYREYGGSWAPAEEIEERLAKALGPDGRAPYDGAHDLEDCND